MKGAAYPGDFAVLRKWISVSTTFVGHHRWPKAPARRAYLRDAHRHRFLVKADMTVEGLDRTVEFHDVLDELNAAIRPLGRRSWDCVLSCEAMAYRCAEALAARWRRPGRLIRVEVSEDGECSGAVEIMCSDV